MGVGTLVLVHVEGRERTACRGQFCASAMWVPGMEVIRLGDKRLYPLRYLTSTPLRI